MAQALRTNLAASFDSTTRDRVPALAGIAGGALVVVGAWLPWFSLYAGLHPLRGTSALNGQLLVAGGLAAVLIGLGLLIPSRRALRWPLGGLGLSLTLFTTWILLGVPATYRAMQENPLLVARLGPGLIVVMLGALLISAGGVLTARRGA